MTIGKECCQVNAAEISEQRKWNAAQRKIDKNIAKNRFWSNRKECEQILEQENRKVYYTVCKNYTIMAKIQMQTITSISKYNN